MLDWKRESLVDAGALIASISKEITACNCCGCLQDEGRCPFCCEKRKSEKRLCLIAHPKDAFSIEQTGNYKGLYHVLGGLISPLDGRGPEHLNLSSLKERIKDDSIQEIIIALDFTVEGDATALYIKREVEPLVHKLSRLAFGLPLGSSLDYVDHGTLAYAFAARSTF